MPISPLDHSRVVPASSQPLEGQSDQDLEQAREYGRAEQSYPGFKLLLLAALASSIKGPCVPGSEVVAGPLAVGLEPKGGVFRLMKPLKASIIVGIEKERARQRMKMTNMQAGADFGLSCRNSASVSPSAQFPPSCTGSRPSKHWA